MLTLNIAKMMLFHRGNSTGLLMANPSKETETNPIFCPKSWVGKRNKSQEAHEASIYQDVGAT
jgi:hypothetical protein